MLMAWRRGCDVRRAPPTSLPLAPACRRPRSPSVSAAPPGGSSPTSSAEPGGVPTCPSPRLVSSRGRSPGPVVPVLRPRGARSAGRAELPPAQRRPGASVVAPQLQPDGSRRLRPEGRAQPLQRLPGDRRLHLVLHGHVRTEGLGVLAGQVRAPALLQPAMEDLRLLGSEPVGDASSEREDLRDGDRERRRRGPRRPSSASTSSRRYAGSAWNIVTCAPTAVRPRGKSSARSASKRSHARSSSCSVTTNGRSSSGTSLTPTPCPPGPSPMHGGCRVL